MANPEASSGTSKFGSGQGSVNDLSLGQECFDFNQMTTLMDSVLPFEACLYHQIVPLSIGASHLNLGMVDPEDPLACNYVKRQIAYINYSLAKWSISSDWHRDVLSKYLSYKSKTKSRSDGQGPSGQDAHQGFHSPPSSATNSADQATFIVDDPIVDDASTIPTYGGGAPSLNHAPREISISSGSHKSSPPVAGKVRHPSSQPPARPKQSADPLELNLPTASLPVSFSAIGKLPPQQLTQALLNRVLQDGIGRLYFERRETAGRILWSKDGIVQAALSDLSLPMLQSVINEFKLFTHLPLVTATKPRQVEIERTYRKERVVLRFRLMIGTYGEEATLQVLRGAALKFYQQQQIDQLGRDALTFAHRLHSQIEEIRERSHQTFTLEGLPASTLMTLSHLLRDIDTEINHLIQKQP